MSNWITKEGGAHTEAGGEVILSSELVGWPLAGVRTVRLHFDTLAGGSVDVYVWGPLNDWVAFDLNKGEGSVSDVEGTWEYIRCVFKATGAVGRVGVQGVAQGW